MDLQAPAGISGPGGGDRLNRIPLVIEGPLKAPDFIRQADMRPHTMKVKGKSIPEAIIMSKDPGVPDTDGIMPHFGKFRHEPKGLLTGALPPKTKIDGPLMKRPDSAFGFLPTKLKQPN
eukprot:1567459-Prymnesium_polylepis.3